MNNQTEKTVQNCAPSSPSRGGKSRPVMAINRVFMTSIDDIKKEQDHRIRKNLGKSRGLAESDSPVRVEHAEDIKVKVEVETNNNILLAGEDGIPLQDREEPSGAEGDDDCEDFAAIQDRPVEDHEDIQVKVFTRSGQSPATAPVKFDCPTPHNVESPDGVPVSPVDDVIVISDSTDSESLEVRKKSKQKHRRKTSLCKENLTIRSPNRQISMAESTSRKCRRRHSKSRDQSKSPSRRSSSSRSSRRHSKSSTSWGDEESPHSRDSSSRRSGSSRTPSRESPTIDLRKRSRSRDSSRIALRDQSESPKRDIKRGHRSRTPQRISKYDKSSEEREVDATCFQEERKDSSLKSNKPKGTVLKGTDRGSLPPQSMSCDVANIPLPPLTKLSSSEQYVDAVESTSEDEMVDNDHETSVSWDSSKRDTSFNKSILKNNSLYNSPQARPTQHNSFIFSPPGHYYHNLPYASSVPPPHHFMYPQDFSTPPPSMSRGIFEWSTASNSFAHAQSPSQMSVHEPRPVPSQSPAATSISSPPITEVDRKFQRLQNLHTPPKPNFYGYQLIGDSMFLRFSQQLLNENAIIAESLRFLGYCVSGQRIGDLLKRLKSGFYHVGKKVIVMIGTNDLLRSTPAQQMRYELKKVIEHLKQSMTENIVILTLPPVPRLQNQTYHWQRLQEYNNYITSLADKGRPLITPVDICKLFVDHRIPKCRLDCFELTFSDNGRKDLIHLNKKGLTMVQDELYKIL